MKKKTIKVWISAGLALLLCGLVLLVVKFLDGGAEAPKPPTQADGSYGVLSWAEYQALSLEERDRYFEQFDSPAAFEAWLEQVRPDEDPASAPQWNKFGKTPDAYSWEEYQNLTREEQDAFYAWFDSAEAFAGWLETNRPTESTEPAPVWNRLGKQPDAYSWEEYQALTPREQDAFFAWFGSADAFEAWMEQVKPAESTAPIPVWNKPGKQPDAYSWAEYQRLTPGEQEAFFAWFGSVDAFEAWMEKVKPAESTAPAPVWNKPGKAPDDYTWAEYQALTPREQDAFYAWFGSLGAFEGWMEKVKPAESTAPAPVWNKPGKAPDAYTWAEYQALSPAEQDAFFEWFDSVEAFEAWMNEAAD